MIKVVVGEWLEGLGVKFMSLENRWYSGHKFEVFIEESYVEIWFAGPSEDTFVGIIHFSDPDLFAKIEDLTK